VQSFEASNQVTGRGAGAEKYEKQVWDDDYTMKIKRNKVEAQGKHVKRSESKDSLITHKRSMPSKCLYPKDLRCSGGEFLKEQKWGMQVIATTGETYTRLE
jgi:hypothetical protein